MTEFVVPDTQDPRVKALDRARLALTESIRAAEGDVRRFEQEIDTAQAAIKELKLKRAPIIAELQKLQAAGR